MTTKTIKSKIHQYVDDADDSILEVVYKLLEVYRQNNTSVLSAEQQKEVLKRAALYKAGKTKTYSLNEVRKRVQAKLKQ